MSDARLPPDGPDESAEGSDRDAGRVGSDDEAVDPVREAADRLVLRRLRFAIAVTSVAGLLLTWPVGGAFGWTAALVWLFVGAPLTVVGAMAVVSRLD